MDLRGQEFPFEAPPANLGDLIAGRLRGTRTILPAPTRDEDPGDIFVDLAERSEVWRRELGTAGAGLLARWVDDLSPSDAGQVAAVGELCYVMARIGSRAALDPLRRLVSDKRATGLVAPGEDLRLRALRALVGLLAAEHPGDQRAYRDVLIDALGEPRLALTSATGLIGLWPEDRDTFLKMLPYNVEHSELLNVAIEIAFLRRP